LRQASAVIAVSEELAARVQDIAGTNPRTIVIPNGVDSGRFTFGERLHDRARLGLPENGPILLSVGRLHVSKGFPVLVGALAALLRDFPEARLAIVGASDPEADALPHIRQAARQLGVENRLLLPGAVSPDTLIKWYSAADVFCLATSREGSPNVLLEALACGLPCVATPVGGIPEVVTDRVGYLVPPDSDRIAEAVAATLRRRWDRNEIRASVSCRSWAHVGERCATELTRAAGVRRTAVACLDPQDATLDL
jgi:glycosyltransferase involved in cell wall biosynthesis